MTTVNHWGKWVDSNEPVTGVRNANNIAYLWDVQPEIDLGYESAKVEFMAQQLAQFQHDHGYDQTPSVDLVLEWETAFDDQCELEGYNSDRYLIGDWLRDDNGQYEPSPNGEYSAIVNTDVNTVQIVRSGWVRYGALCSPCYPGQVDLDTDGEFLGYELPPDRYEGNCKDTILRWLADEKRAIGKEGDSIL